MVPNSILVREKCLHHHSEIIRLTAEKEELSRSTKPSPGLTFTNRFWTPEGVGRHHAGQLSDKMMTRECFSEYRETLEMEEELELEKMLADLREGSVEVNN